MAQAITYSFEVKIASRGYHVYKNTARVNAKEDNEVQVEIKTNKDSIKLILMHVQCAFRVNILMSRKQLGISQEKFLDMCISSLRKKKAGSNERFFLLSIGHHQYRQEAWKFH